MGTVRGAAQGHGWRYRSGEAIAGLRGRRSTPEKASRSPIADAGADLEIAGRPPCELLSRQRRASKNHSSETPPLFPAPLYLTAFNTHHQHTPRGLLWHRTSKKTSKQVGLPGVAAALLCCRWPAFFAVAGRSAPSKAPAAADAVSPAPYALPPSPWLPTSFYDWLGKQTTAQTPGLVAVGWRRAETLLA